MVRLALALAAFLLLPLASAAATVEIDLVEDEAWEKPQKVVFFPARITNAGDAATRVAFALASNPDGLNAVVPPPVALAPGESKDVLFTVQTPFRNGYVDDEGRVTYRATPEGGEPQEFAVTVHTKGFYAPGPQLFGAMLAIGMAALLLRRGSS